MSGGFGTQPGDLDAAAARFDEASDVVATALADLRSTLGGLGDYLGSDEQGRAFAAEYDPKVAEGVAALDDEARGLRSLVDGLRASAREYANGDASAAARLTPPGGG